MSYSYRASALRPTALLLAASLLSPLVAGCSGHQNDAVPPPVTDATTSAPPSTSPAAAPKPGMSTGKKVAIVLAGAALLYYLHKHNVEQNGQHVQYYRSKKNGRIYYRDPSTHQAHYVTPAASYQVDSQEAAQLQQYQGYNNQGTGQDYQAAGDTGTE